MIRRLLASRSPFALAYEERLSHTSRDNERDNAGSNDRRSDWNPNMMDVAEPQHGGYPRGHEEQAEVG